MCHKNQIQLHKNCSVDDFNVYMIQTGLVTEENTTCANGATFFVNLGPVQGRCVGHLTVAKGLLETALKYNIQFCPRALLRRVSLYGGCQKHPGVVPQILG